MKALVFALSLALGTAAQAASPAADASAEAVLTCIRSNVPSSLRVQHIELSNTDRAGNQRNVAARLYAQREVRAGKGEIRASLRVVGPENLAGSAFLVREAAGQEPGMYVYLPAVRRVRRITGEFADGALLGTDFSYTDFRHFQGVFDATGARLEAPATLEGRSVYVLSFTQPKGSRYGRVRAWVDEKTCVPLKLDFYENHQLIKQLTAPVAGLKQAQNYWYPVEVQMQDLRSGTQSSLRVQQVEIGGKLPGKLFSPTLFYQ